MELILTTNNKTSIEKIKALANELDVAIEERGEIKEKKNKEEFKKFILEFKASGPSSFGDAAEWERREREDRD